jgi:beta-glucuronidase
MIRTFNTHSIRKQRELTGRYWNFTPCQGDYAGESFKVATPSCFESYPKFANYRGQGEYSTTFEAQGNIRLEFKGVSHTAEVFLDGRKIAEHYNAYTIFDAVCTDLKPGVHTLMVRADNRFSEKSALHIPNDYMTYGGIIRPIVLEEVRAAYIQYVHVTPYRANGKWNARVTVKLKNVFSKDSVSKEEKRFDLALELAGLNVMLSDIDITTQQEITTECVFENVEAWTPEHPQLYEVQVRLLQKGMVYDDLIDRFGFREIHVSGKEIYLNDKKIRIKGLCRHEDHPQFGCALPFAAMAADLELIKDLGANSIRTSHYPNDEIFLDMCDENGILVWEENHARGLSEEAMRNSNFEWQAEQVITEMIPAHYNHPSIYIWGILNECASETEYGRECYRRQFDLIRSLDTSRPCSFASCKIKTDICLDLPDVVSYNIYPLWYHDTPVEEYLDDLYQWIQRDTKGSGKPFLVTEIGAGGLYGYRNAYHSKWTEEYQAQALEKQLTAVLSYKDCMGVYIWQFCDIRISDECFAGRPRTMNNKGIVDEYRRAKLAYDVVKRIYHEIN